ncbi:hypothetical protein LINGRAHAP2_LOCUS38850 [Linum grandiflorum]
MLDAPNWVKFLN